MQKGILSSFSLLLVTVGMFAEDAMNEQVKNVHGTYQGKIASHGVTSGLYLNGSFLYCQARIDNLEYAARNLLNFDRYSEDIISVKSKVFDLHYQWNPGVRWEVGYIFKNKEQWNLSLSGMHLTTKGHGSVRASSNGDEQFFPLWVPNLMGQLISFGSANWRLNFNTLDLDLGRDFFISKWISIHPYFGVRGAWIHQKYRVKYHSLSSVVIPNGDVGDPILIGPDFFTDFSLDHDSKLENWNDFNGFGFRLGTQLLMHLTKNIGILGNFSGSLVYGIFDVKRKVDAGFISDDIIASFLDHELGLLNVFSTDSAKFHRLRSNIDMELGLQWENYFHNEAFRFFASASYLYSIWYDQLELRNSWNAVSPDPVAAPIYPAAAYDPTFFVSERRTGNLQIQGLVVRVGIDF